MFSIRALIDIAPHSPVSSSGNRDEEARYVSLLTSFSRHQRLLSLICLVLCLLGGPNLGELYADSIPGVITEIAGKTMGTTYHIKWVDQVAEQRVNKNQIKSLVDARLVEINRMMSTYDPESELSRFNAYRETSWFPVSAETAKVVQAALEISELSGGAFDPTVGRLVRLWSFGREPQRGELPTEEAIADALRSVGYRFVVVQISPPALSKSNIDVELDLSAIAKGYGVDVILELLAGQSILDCMVEIGGEVRVAGTKSGEPWRLGIERPGISQRSLHAQVELQDQALATSGNYRNFFEQDGVRYSHTIDPRTGRPVTHQLASASVFAADCMTADAWATALMVLGSSQGLQLADKLGLSAYLLEYDDRSFKEFSSQAVAGQFVSLVHAPSVPVATTTPLLTTFLLTISVFGIAMLGLAAGLVLSNRTLKGTCGGVNGLKDDQGKSICEMCTTPPEECEQLKQKIREELQQQESEPTS